MRSERDVPGLSLGHAPRVSWRRGCVNMGHGAIPNPDKFFGLVSRSGRPSGPKNLSGFGILERQRRKRRRDGAARARARSCAT
jgi:hypothetical protein